MDGNCRVDARMDELKRTGRNGNRSVPKVKDSLCIKQHLDDEQDEKSLFQSTKKIVEEIPHQEWIKTFKNISEDLKSVWGIL